MRFVEPMNARAEDRTRNIASLEGNDAWWMEQKLDGYRLVVINDDEHRDPETGHPTLAGFSRAGKDQLIEDRTPDLWCDLDGILPNGYTVLDGELSTWDDDFSHVAGVMKSLPERARRLQFETSKQVQYVVFDVLFWDGNDMRDTPLLTRRAFLQGELGTRPAKRVRLADVYPVSRERVTEWQARGREGAILKNGDSTYACGKRPTDTWIKIKNVQDEDVVIMGFTEGKGKYVDQIGAIIFGQYVVCPRCQGDLGKFDCGQGCQGSSLTLKERGQCSGMTDATRADMSVRDNQRELLGQVMVITHMGEQRDGFRHPQFKHIRRDKKPLDCSWDEHAEAIPRPRSTT